LKHRVPEEEVIMVVEVVHIAMAVAAALPIQTLLTL